MSGVPCSVHVHPMALLGMADHSMQDARQYNRTTAVGAVFGRLSYAYHSNANAGDSSSRASASTAGAAPAVSTSMNNDSDSAAPGAGATLQLDATEVIGIGVVSVEAVTGRMALDMDSFEYVPYHIGYISSIIVFTF